MFYSEMGAVAQAMLDNQVLTADQLIKVLPVARALHTPAPTTLDHASFTL